MNIIRTKQDLLANFPTCYACEAQSTSMEHAPPKCFFPEDTDAKGNCMFRKDLIKVPSCHRHNTQKSGDDLYALWHLASLKGVNECGIMMHKKLRRIAEHDREKRGGAFMKRLMDEAVGTSKEGDFAGLLDADRMQQFLCMLARALYFYEKFEKLIVPLKVANMSNCYRDEAHLQALMKKEMFFESELQEAKILGANPEVFSYSILEKSDGTILVQMVFYGTLKNWVFHSPGLTDVLPKRNFF